MCDWEGLPSTNEDTNTRIKGGCSCEACELPGSERLVSRKLEMGAWSGSYSCIRDIFVDGALSRDLLLSKLVSGKVDVSELEIGGV